MGVEQLRVAIVHYWFVSRRGGERVLQALCELFPQADLFALVANETTLSDELQRHKLQTSFLQRIPGSRRWHRYFLPLYPFALEQFDLSEYDLVISSESGPAKGVITSTRTCHICYCHSPMRYLWDACHVYKSGNELGLLRRCIFSLTAHYLRIWDLASASRVDYFVANSNNVAARIRKHYRRDSQVIYPPVQTSRGYVSRDLEDYYLVVGHLVEYKRVDLAIHACNQLRRTLVIVGEGERYKDLRRIAGPTISFIGRLSDDELFSMYARCRALLFPGEEDFGIVPVEAQSCGRPVIAYGGGGALESVAEFDPLIGADPEYSTGLFFREQSVSALIDAMQRFETIENRFSPIYIRNHSRRFDESCFRTDLSRFIRDKYAEYRSQEHASRACATA